MIALLLWLLVTLVVLGVLWKIGEIILGTLGLGDPWMRVWQLVVLLVLVVVLLHFALSALGVGWSTGRLLP